MDNRTQKKDFNEIKMEDIIDLKFLQELQDNFSKGTGTASVSIDDTGSPVTEGSCFTDFCMKLTRGCKIGNERCQECDKKGGEESYRTGKPAVYTCHAGLTDYAAPIVLQGKIIGSVIGGQVLTAPPDEDKFRKIALEIGVDPNEYIEALRKVKVVEKDRVEAIAKVLYMMANTLSKLGYNQYKLEHMGKNINESLQQISQAMEGLASSAVTVSENQQSLNKEIQSIKELSSKIYEIIGSIKSIADQTKMLGLNAAIEAARAGEFGKGFGVVSDEIRKLSDSSKETAAKVIELTSNIQTSVSKTLETSDYTSKTTENEAASIQQINSGLQEVLSMTTEMKELAHDLK